MYEFAERDTEGNFYLLVLFTFLFIRRKNEYMYILA